MEALTHETEQALLDLSSAFLRNTRLATKEATVLVQEQARIKHKFRSSGGSAGAVAAIDTDFANTGDKSEGIVWLNPDIALHAIFLHEGTGKYGDKGKVYNIFPKNFIRLRFLTSPGTAPWRPDPFSRFHKGGFTFAKGVTHPGIKGEPFVYNALDAKEDEIEQTYLRYFEKTVREAGLS